MFRGLWARVRVVFAVAVALAFAGTARADRMVALDRAARDPSWRVRLQVASVLAKQTKPANSSILLRLLEDVNPSVRSVAAAALGRLEGLEGADRARVATALDLATHDSVAAVRDHARVSLARLAPEPDHAPSPPTQKQGVHIAIGGVGAKPKNVSPEMTRRLRELLVQEFTHTPGMTVDGKPVSGFLIDSSITALNQRTTVNWVEVNCEISVIVGRLPSKAVVMMTSGGATVQQPKMGLTPARKSELEVDALEGAVKGAHENLLAYLRQQR